MVHVTCPDEEMILFFKRNLSKPENDTSSTFTPMSGRPPHRSQGLMSNQGSGVDSSGSIMH